MTNTEVDEIIKEALEILIKKDKYLLENDANERSISHRLAVILELDEKLEGYNIDCEYNRDKHDTKRLKLPIDNTTSNNTEAKTVFPDIIIHKRGDNDNNLAVIEMKKFNPDTDDEDKDYEKLKAFKDELGYKNCYFIKFENPEDLKYLIFDERKQKL